MSDGKTHDHRKARKRTNYRCSTSPGGIRVVDLYFPKIIEEDGEDRGSVKGSYSWGDDKDMRG
jgi:hypothetical protein